jgi:hypothetical protein
MVKRLSLAFRLRHHRCFRGQFATWPVVAPCLLAGLLACLLAYR